jgi:hypothetical protein
MNKKEISDELEKVLQINQVRYNLIVEHQCAEEYVKRVIKERMKIVVFLLSAGNKGYRVTVPDMCNRSWLPILAQYGWIDWKEIAPPDFLDQGFRITLRGLCMLDFLKSIILNEVLL